MKFVRSLILSAAAAWFIGLAPASMKACSCIVLGTALDSFETSETVIVARAVSFERSNSQADRHGIHSTKLVVVKSYKGSFKPGDEMIFAQGGGGDCVWTFREESLGKEFLLYLNSNHKRGGMWEGPICSRSSSVDYAWQDVLFLDNLVQRKGRTRLSGTIRFRQDDAARVDGIKVRIVGGKKPIEMVTDSHGVFELYDLPPGTYSVETRIPKGWKFGPIRTRRSSSQEEIEQQRVLVTASDSVTLEPGRHAETGFSFEIDNFVRGRILDPQGNPLNGVCLHAVDPDPKVDVGYHADCTENDGRFEISGLPSGNYILAVNPRGEISSDHPFGTFFYPGQTDRAKATILRLEPGSVVDGLDIVAPTALETITVEGVLLYSDGSPVANESVNFVADVSDASRDGDAQAPTDANGRFSIKILKGLTGQLFGYLSTYEGEYPNCPEINRLIRAAGTTFGGVKTPTVTTTAVNNITGQMFKFPFPRCDMKKDD